MNERRTGYSMLVIGPPGTGKSEFAASIAPHTDGKVKLLALRPKEIDSAGYVKHGINAEAELFHDPGWLPSIGSFEAGAWAAFLTRLRELQTDEEYGAVIVDPITDLNEIIGHALLAPVKAADPHEAGDPRSYYGNLKKRMMEAVKAMTYLAYAQKPKHVVAVVHARPAGEEDDRVREVKYMGRIQAALEGSIRHEIGGEFQMQLFTDLRVRRENVSKGRKPKFETVRDYGLLIQPNNDRFAKLNVYVDEARIPNDFGALLGAIESGGGE